MTFKIGNKRTLDYIITTVDSLFEAKNMPVGDNKELSAQRRHTLLKYLNRSDIGLDAKLGINKGIFADKY